MIVQCPYCFYIWKSRKTRPKECPSCKRYLVVGKVWVGKIIPAIDMEVDSKDA